MKNIIIIFLLGFFFCSCKDNPVEVQRVYTLEESMPYLKSIECYNENNSTLKYVYDYTTNSQGLITRIDQYWGNRDVYYSYCIYHNDNGKLLSKCQYYQNLSYVWFAYDSTIYIYDGEKLKSEDRVSSGWKKVYEYQGEKLLSRKEYYDNTLCYTNEYHFIDNYLTEEYYYYEVGGRSLFEHIIYRYDKGRVTSKTYYDGQSILKSSYTYDYDSEGRVISEKCRIGAAYLAQSSSYDIKYIY